MRLVLGISRADMTACNVVVVAVAVIARMQLTLNFALSNDALSLVYDGRKLCDLKKVQNLNKLAQKYVR